MPVGRVLTQEGVGIDHGRLCHVVDGRHGDVEERAAAVDVAQCLLLCLCREGKGVY